MADSEMPKLVVFDLDYTLWPFWVDTHVDPPFKKDKDGRIVDSRGKKVKCYPEVPECLEQLHKDGLILAVASRTTELRGANQLIDLFGWRKYFSYYEIYPGCKITHLKKIEKDSGIPLKEMIFFDDEHRNIVDLNSVGVVSILVKDGVSKRVIKDGLREFANRK